MESLILVGIFGMMVGVAVGWTWGVTAEQKLWLDAICGRERIAKRRPNAD